ncbi:glycosyl hydrolase family 92-domain-containing protein [Rhexocercosporidium sp. MPI-PUGE-AT-0058]|nr:glycosyl hydrolase family 92-domain-containing protein [Rhexocercosporidium sp. MPI-PUGE-AT-0058]
MEQRNARSREKFEEQAYKIMLPGANLFQDESQKSVFLSALDKQHTIHGYEAFITDCLPELVSALQQRKPKHRQRSSTGRKAVSRGVSKSSSESTRQTNPRRSLRKKPDTPPSDSCVRVIITAGVGVAVAQLFSQCKSLGNPYISSLTRGIQNLLRRAHPRLRLKRNQRKRKLILSLWVFLRIAPVFSNISECYGFYFLCRFWLFHLLPSLLNTVNMSMSCGFPYTTTYSPPDVSRTGTKGVGNSFPGVARPFGIVKLGLDLLVSGTDSYSGYLPNGNFSGFSMMHDDRVVVELAAASRAGMYQYTFPSSGSGNNILIDVSHVVPSFRGQGLGQGYAGGHFTIEADGHYEASGIYNNGCETANNDSQGGYFNVTLSAANVFSCTSTGGSVIQPPGSANSSSSTDYVGGLFAFDTSVVSSRVDISWISNDQACQNLNDQIPEDASFSKTGENPVWTSSEPYCQDVFALWDTCRCSTALMQVISPVAYEEYIRAVIDTYRFDGYLLDERSSNYNGRTQGGSNADNVLADAYVKGVHGQVNWNDGFVAISKDAEVTPPNTNPPDPMAPDSSTKESRGALPDWEVWIHHSDFQPSSIPCCRSWADVHDFGNIVNLMGGLNTVFRRLETMFTVGANPSNPNCIIHDATNEPDEGAMQTWLLWNMIGLYPITGQTTFLIHSPWYESMTINLGTGKSLKVTSTGGDGNGDSNIYVQSLKVNGQTWGQKLAEMERRLRQWRNNGLRTRS